MARPGASYPGDLDRTGVSSYSRHSSLSPYSQPPHSRPRPRPVSEISSALSVDVNHDYSFPRHPGQQQPEDDDIITPQQQHTTNHSNTPSSSSFSNFQPEKDQQPSQPSPIQNKNDPPPTTTTSQPPPSPPTTPNSPPGPEETRTSLQTTLIILSLASALFLAALDITIITVAIPTIAAEFESTSGYTWIGSSYMLASAAAAPMWGKISDIWGRKPIILFAAGVFWVGSLLAGVARSMGMLIAARAVQGVGGGGLVILVNICISDLFSLRKRGVYFGIMGMVWAVASAVGPVLGGVFTSKVSWRWCFYVNLPISGIGMAVLAFILKLHNPRTPMRQGLKAVDWFGSLTIVGGTLMILMGLELGGVSQPWNSATVICLIIFGVITAGIFVVIEWKVAEFPIIPLRIFNSRSKLASLAVCAVQSFVFISGSYYMPLYFQAVLGASPLISGLYALPFALSLSGVSALTGVFIKKTGKYLPCIIFGMATMALGFGLFIDLGAELNLAKLIMYQIIAGIGVGPNFQAPLIALQTTVQSRDIGSATGTFGFVRQLFTSISVVVGGVVFQNRMQAQFDTLVEELGPKTAELLSGHNAASNVAAVAALQGKEGEIAREAYLRSLRTMYVLYVAVSGLGLVLSFFVGSRTLSKTHEEHKTGLEAMRAANDHAGGRGRKKGGDDEHGQPGENQNGEEEGERVRRIMESTTDEEKGIAWGGGVGLTEEERRKVRDELAADLDGENEGGDGDTTPTAGTERKTKREGRIFA